MLIVSMINPHDKKQGFSPRRTGGSVDSTLNSCDAQGEPGGDYMRTSASLDKSLQARAKPFRNIAVAIRQAPLVGAVVGLAGGFFAATSGAVFTVASWFVANEGVRQWLSTTGTILFFLTIPLIIFGGYCMDWIDKDKPRRNSKVARYENEDEDQ
jgi:hypothetical protein